LARTLIKNLIYVGLGLVISPGFAFGQDGEYRTIQQYTFGVGETMEYAINYGVISAGVAKIYVDNYVLAGDQVCYRLVSEARSRKFFDLFFKVRDRVESWMDVEGLFSWRFEKELNEGKYHDHKVVTYDYENGRATLIDDGEPTDTTKVDQEMQDALSSLFWARLLPFKKDTILTVETLDVRKVYQVKLVVLGIDTVQTPAGSFRCYKTEPHLEGGGIFKKDPGGRIWLWFTDDALKIPVMMQTKVFFGHVSARLTKYLPGQMLPSDVGLLKKKLEHQQ
jgi:hypothetical protein